MMVLTPTIGNDYRCEEDVRRALMSGKKFRVRGTNTLASRAMLASEKIVVIMFDNLTHRVFVRMENGR